MGEVNKADPAKLLDAVRIWAGWGGTSPNRDDARLTQLVGSKEASVLLPIIRTLEEDFYASDARYTASDLEEMARLSKEHFALIHPRLPTEIGEVFAWCYTFDFK